MHNLRLALRFARRELRGGLAGFRVFFLCLVLGSAGTSTVTLTEQDAAPLSAQAGASVTAGEVADYLVQTPGTVSLGQAFDLLVTPVDAFGNVLPTFPGGATAVTLAFASDDPQAAPRAPDSSSLAASSRAAAPSAAEAASTAHRHRRSRQDRAESWSSANAAQSG